MQRGRRIVAVIARLALYYSAAVPAAAIDIDPLVLHITDEHASSEIPPGDIRVEMDYAGSVVAPSLPKLVQQKGLWSNVIFRNLTTRGKDTGKTYT